MTEQRELTLTINREIDEELTALAITTGIEKPDLARTALEEWLEDTLDALAASVVLANGNPTMSLAEVRRGFDLED